MQHTDTSTRYGWVSIALHWTGAIAVVMLWFIGNVMTAEGTGPEKYAELVGVHTSVAVTVYVLLAGRVVHRFTVGFPEPVGKLSPFAFTATRLIQYTLLGSLAAMLISGPLMVWSEGGVIAVFSWGGIPAPFSPNDALHDLMTQVHATTRWVLLVAALLHVAGVFRGGSEMLNRMLLAPEEKSRSADRSHGEF